MLKTQNFRTKDTFRIFWRHARAYPWLILVLSASLLGATIAEVFGPFFYKQLFDLLSASGSLPALLAVVLKILAAASLAWFFWRIATFANNMFQPAVMRDLVNTCFNYLHDHSFNFFTNNFAGSLVKKIGRYERAFEDITDQIYWSLAPTTLKISIIVGILYFVRPVFALAVLVWSAVYIIFSIWFAFYKLKYDVENAELDTEVGGRLADTITNNVNVKLFGGFNRESKSFEQLTQRQYKIRKWTWDLGSINEAVQGALFAILEFTLLSLAVRLWKHGLLTLGDFALLQGYMVQMFGRLWDLGRQIKNIYSRLGDAEEMTEILLTPHEIQDKPNARKLKIAGGKIDFKDVTFGYHNRRKIFQNFNLTITPGERVALIGPSGGGKTTIVKLLFRFFDIQSGQIMIDGQNISRVTQASLRSAMSLVPQEPILFHRSLFENIAYGNPNATRDDVIKAAKSAHCHEFIVKFPEQYETLVGERGIKLSGGERQRVAIARAILKNAPILVLDEATSSLDSESEYYIQDALKNLMKGKTTIVIAHRLSTIMQMDRIIVIEKGRIKEEGRHEELLKVNQGTYQKLWHIQAGGFAKA
ncbi:MAG: ABC transporter ATP-binding protein [Candidatus Doudnabacteria bacterium]